MDARDYDRIADLLMQIRKKIDALEPASRINQVRQAQFLESLQELLWELDILATHDKMGWL